MNYVTKPRVCFKNGTRMTVVDETVYLGGILTKNGDAATEVSARIRVAGSTAKKLKVFWNNTSCSKKWKALVYNAVVISQLIYGLETLPLTNNLLNKLDAFQMRGFRKY